MIGWIVLALVILAIVASVAIYNRLVNYRNDAKNAFAQIDVQLTRRYDLIPNLVEVARKYLQHEQETLTAVIAARNHAANALKNTEGSGGSTGVGALAAAERLTISARGRAAKRVPRAYPRDWLTLAVSPRRPANGPLLRLSWPVRVMLSMWRHAAMM